MRIAFLLVVSVFTLSLSHAQPVNDSCSGAIELNLSNLFPCPFTTTSSNFFIYNNTNATPSDPYPSFFDCGAEPNSPAAEVWFSLVPKGENITIQIEGLQTPNVVLFQGENCSNLLPFYCASSEPDSGYLEAVLTLEPMQKYYMMVAGEDPADQGSFNIIIKNQRDCNACNLKDSFSANPPPINGTYHAGDTVQFCYTINQWDITNVIEWPHSLEVLLGDGWDENSFVPTPPPSCDGNGNWNWYNEWESCNTGQIFGPGFAYESSIGINCGGNPMDNNPGNNWGDGSGSCAGIGTTAPPIEFCWTIAVDECLGINNQTDLSILLDLHSDGESGSWIQIGCNTQAEFHFLASAICIDTLPPFLETTPASCPGNCDGSIRFAGSGEGPWDFAFYNQDSTLLLENFNTFDTLSVPDLCAGNYLLDVTNTNTGHSQYLIVEVAEISPPIAIANNTGPACPGESISLLGSSPDTSNSVQYHWTGPDGYESDEQNPSLIPVNGIYVLKITSNNCTSEPDTTTVEIAPLPQIDALPNDTLYACRGEVIQITALGAKNYIWENATDSILGTEALLEFTLTENETLNLVGGNEFGCVDSIEITLMVLPESSINLSLDTVICSEGSAILEVSGGQTYLWSTGETNTSIEVSPAETSIYSVTATDANGCTVVQEVTVTVNNDFLVEAGPSQSQCVGSSFAFNAIVEGGIPPYQFSWNDPDQTSGAFLLVTPDTTTVYTVTVMDALGCVSTDEVMAQFLEPNFTVTASPALICSGQKSTLSVEGGTVLEWSTGAISNSIDVTPTETTTYSVMVVSSNNCLFTFEITVEVFPLPDLPEIQCHSEQETIAFTWSPIPDSFNIIINTGQSGDLMADGLLVEDLSPQETVGVTMEIFDDEGCIYTLESSCTTPACPEFNLQIQPVEPICLSPGLPSITLNGSIIGGNGTGTFLWSGPGVSSGGTFNPFEAGPGVHTIILNYFQGNCSISESILVHVETQLLPPIITCNQTDIAVEFSWETVPGASDYDVFVISGQEGLLIGNVFTVVDLTPGEIVTVEVIVQGNGNCGNSSSEATCIALSCTELALSLADTTTVCHGDSPFTIPVSVINGLGDGSFNWSGDCVNPVTGLIDPQVCGIGSHNLSVTYTEGNCTITTETTITILPPASAQFAATPTICFGQMATAIFTGPIVNGSTFQWDFGGGVANTGVGPGPHVINWDTPGEKTISLSILANGCIAGPYTQTVIVQEEMGPPSVICQPGPGLVTFINVPDPAIDPVSYSISINSELISPSIVENNQIFIEGLTPGDTVTLALVIFDPGPCDNVTASYSCIVEDCPDITIAVEQTPQLCLEDGVSAFILESEIIGVNLDGERIWTGPGIVDSTSGLFNPLVAGIGIHQVTLSYVDGPCSYSTSVDIEIVGPPVISNINVNCNAEGNYYSLSFEVQNDTTTHTITSDSVPSGETLNASFIIEESCRPVYFDLVRSCNCQRSAGLMAEATQCGLETVTAQYLGGANLNMTDLLQFYLHDNSGNVLGKVFGKSNFPIFSFDPNQMEYGQVYYVSAVVGPNSGSGQIDLNDPCLSISLGQPVVFSQSPELIGANEYTLCAGQSATFDIDLPVTADVTWSPNASLSCTTCAQTTASPIVTTTYTAEVIDIYGCSSSFEVTVYIDEFPTGSFPDTALSACPGKSFEFCLPDAESYSWTGPNNYNLPNQCLFIPNYEPNMAGTYTAGITLSDGCILTESIEIITDDPLVVNSITPDTSVCRFSFFTLRADVEGADHYFWFPASNVSCQNCSSTHAYINNTTVFTLIAIANSGCQIRRQITVSRTENCGGLEYSLIDNQSGINNDNDIELYPNPANLEVNIRAAATLEKVEIYTLEGKLLYNIATKGHHHIIDVSNLPEGTYLARIRSDQGIKNKKFVVMK